jgi:hypothetical protein
VAGKYVAKDLTGKSCSKEKDCAWKWKSEEEQDVEGGLEFGKSNKRSMKTRKELILPQCNKARL